MRGRGKGFFFFFADGAVIFVWPFCAIMLEGGLVGWF